MTASGRAVGQASVDGRDADIAPREVVEDPEFAKQVASLGLDTLRFDEILFAVTWRLARTPEECMIAVDGRPDLRITKTLCIGDVPAHRILFRLEDSRVVLLDISKVPPVDSYRE